MDAWYCTDSSIMDGLFELLSGSGGDSEVLISYSQNVQLTFTSDTNFGNEVQTIGLDTYR